MGLHGGGDFPAAAAGGGLEEVDELGGGVEFDQTGCGADWAGETKPVRLVSALANQRLCSAASSQPTEKVRLS